MPFDGTELNPDARHLLRAKEWLLNHGWCQKPFDDVTGAGCVATAIGKTNDHRGADGFSWAAWWMCEAVGVEPSIWDGHSIGQWNDTPGRTLQEVLDMFDTAIAIAIEKSRS